jgi:hypothetical protein
MRRNGLPDRQNIRRCIRVSVVGRATFRARPFPHVQRQFLYDMSAVGTGLRGWEPAVDLDHGFPVSLSLVQPTIPDLTPLLVIGRFGFVLSKS